MVTVIILAIIFFIYQLYRYIRRVRMRDRVGYAIALLPFEEWAEMLAGIKDDNSRETIVDRALVESSKILVMHGLISSEKTVMKFFRNEDVCKTNFLMTLMRINNLRRTDEDEIAEYIESLNAPAMVFISASLYQHIFINEKGHVDEALTYLAENSKKPFRGWE